MAEPETALPPGTVEILLSQPLPRPNDAPLAKLCFRPPRGGDYFALGEPLEVGRTEAGNAFTVEREGVIEGYARRLLLPPGRPQHLEALALADAMRVKGAVLGFFTQAWAEPPPTPSAFSSST